MADSGDEERVAVVAGLDQSPDGTWWIEAFDGRGHHRFPLRPLQLVLRFMLEPNGLMRGTIELPAAGLTAPFHCNQQIISMLQTWLGRDEPHEP